MPDALLRKVFIGPDVVAVKRRDPGPRNRTPEEADAAAQARFAERQAKPRKIDALDFKFDLEGFYNAIPFADEGSTTRPRTCLPSQLRFMMLALDVTREELAARFDVKLTAVKAWLTGDKLVPVGIAEYMRLRTISRIRALALGAGVSVSTEADYEDKLSQVAVDTIKRMMQEIERAQAARGRDLRKSPYSDTHPDKIAETVARKFALSGVKEGTSQKTGATRSPAGADPLDWLVSAGGVVMSGEPKT